jgi:hypothetical protein
MRNLFITGLQVSWRGATAEGAATTGSLDSRDRIVLEVLDQRTALFS